MKRVARTLTLSLVVLVAAGCMGSFVLTRKLYAWNESFTDSKMVNNLVFWGLNILPVYSLAVAGDAVILNLIEFWSGSNPLGDAKVTMVTNPDGTITLTRGDEVFVLVPRGDNRVDVLVDGALAGSAEHTDVGGIVAFDASGHEIGVVTPEEVEVSERVVAAELAR